MSNINLYNYVDSIKDFPKKGILFRDISPLLQDYNAFSELRALFYNESVKHKIDYVAGLDARGFLFSSLLAAIVLSFSFLGFSDFFILTNPLSP